MKFFNRETAVVTPKPATTARKLPVVDGWSEQELVSIYNAAPIRRLQDGEFLFGDVQHTDSFFILLEGSIQVVVDWDGHAGRPGIFQRGDCLAPLPKSPGLLYCAEVVETCTLIEITPAVLKFLPDKTQLCIYKAAVAATSRINAYIRAVNGEVNSKNVLLSSYVAKHKAKSYASAQSEFVQDFMRNMPRMPVYALDLTMRMLDETTSVQEVVEGIKRDPSLAGNILRIVNSAQYAFQKKIESFHHAVMILGFVNIHNLILRDVVQSAMPSTEEMQRTHEHSCLISVLCNEIASAAKNVQAQTATTVGLLHDIGKGVQLLMKHSQPSKTDSIDLLLPDKLGADLLQVWGLPDRICKIVEFQQYPEFTPPDLIGSEYRRETGTLHLAHVLELLLTGQPVAPELTIYTRDYMAILGLTGTTPTEFLNNRVLPNLKRNRHRLPEQIQDVISAPGAGREERQQVVS